MEVLWHRCGAVVVVVALIFIIIALTIVFAAVVALNIAITLIFILHGNYWNADGWHYDGCVRIVACSQRRALEELSLIHI